MRERIAVFDFDGTITKTDTFFAFISFTKGKFNLFLRLVMFGPLICFSVLGLYDKGKVKELIFHSLFKGSHVDDFETLSNNFFTYYVNYGINTEAVEKIRYFQKRQIKVYVITASPDLWVKPFMVHLGIDEKNLLATKVEIDLKKYLTGYFSTPNCNGKEKVNRLQKKLKKSREKYYIYAYGDSEGDKDLLQYSDEAYLQRFD